MFNWFKLAAGTKLKLLKQCITVQKIFKLYNSAGKCEENEKTCVFKYCIVYTDHEIYLKVMKPTSPLVPIRLRNPDSSFNLII